MARLRRPEITRLGVGPLDKYESIIGAGGGRERSSGVSPEAALRALEVRNVIPRPSGTLNIPRITGLTTAGPSDKGVGMLARSVAEGKQSFASPFARRGGLSAGDFRRQQAQAREMELAVAPERMRGQNLMNVEELRNKGNMDIEQERTAREEARQAAMTTRGGTITDKTNLQKMAQDHDVDQLKLEAQLKQMEQVRLGLAVDSPEWDKATLNEIEQIREQGKIAGTLQDKKDANSLANAIEIMYLRGKLERSPQESKEGYTYDSEGRLTGRTKSIGGEMPPKPAAAGDTDNNGVPDADTLANNRANFIREYDAAKKSGDDDFVKSQAANYDLAKKAHAKWLTDKTSNPKAQ